jgi:hypothetical protein
MKKGLHHAVKALRRTKCPPRAIRPATRDGEAEGTKELCPKPKHSSDRLRRGDATIALAHAVPGATPVQVEQA